MSKVPLRSKPDVVVNEIAKGKLNRLVSKFGKVYKKKKLKIIGKSKVKRFSGLQPFYFHST